MIVQMPCNVDCFQNRDDVLSQIVSILREIQNASLTEYLDATWRSAIIPLLSANCSNCKGLVIHSMKSDHSGQTAVNDGPLVGSARR